ncbi:MAG: hypothetical protein U5K69_04845 [Balneolaceae bacterium]|nr:hypothetical protein [Balneolaceae bacterium]
MPPGTFVYNIELHPGQGGQLCRSAGTQAQMVAKHGPVCNRIKLPSA